jgi:Rrf2 family transcriptional regulator, nitric oxide-sensitive transcriptional repressor
MRLTLSTDYALRTLIYLGAERDGLATITEIAGAFDISKAHLMKVVNRLSQQGYIETVRGKGGGIRLAHQPEAVCVGDVVRDAGEELAVMNCLANSGVCTIERCCILRKALREATEAFLAVLDNYTLADLLAPGARLLRSLGLEQATQS